MTERVVLVDDRDRALGSMDKLEAHRAGRLHRAFSVLVLNGDDEALLQRRAPRKYHSGGLWTNTCCSHPRPGEAVEDAARRRLREEMGVDCPVERVSSFTYRAEVGGGLVEHELDHVLIGRWDGRPEPDPAEVAGWRWVPVPDLLDELAQWPERFTAWLPPVLRELERHDRLPPLGEQRVA